MLNERPIPIVGAIIAGGAASRLGGEKPFRPFAGTTLIDHVAARFSPQVEGLALNLKPGVSTPSELSSVIHDRAQDLGPLGGVLTALEWACRRGASLLATVPCDTPFLPSDLVAQLLHGAAPDRSAYACDERAHYLCALWPVSALERLRDQARTRHRLSEAHACLGGRAVPIRATPYAFFNVNSCADLIAAESIFRQEFGQNE